MGWMIFVVIVVGFLLGGAIGAMYGVLIMFGIVLVFATIVAVLEKLENRP